MSSHCPICDQSIASTVDRCGVCGFPTAFAVEGLRAVQEVDATPVGDPVRPPEAKPPAPPPDDGLREQADLCSAISEDLQTRLVLLRELRADAPDVTGEMCHAALVQADGHVAEALEILRNAQARLARRADDVFEERVAKMNEVLGSYKTDGLSLALAQELPPLRALHDEGSHEEALARLGEVERRLSQFQADWKGLRGLLTQIESLRTQAADIGVPLGEISSEVEEIWDRLKSGPLDDETLDRLAEQAAQTLMLLHEAIPTALETELGQHETTLNRYPDDHPPAAKARRLHVEATRHLRKGRLADAVASVRDLRVELEALRHVEETPAPAPVPKVSETEPETLARLLKKARSLAARVRALPPDSEASFEAASEIRRATEFLRDRRLDDAELTLTRLMRTLGAEAPRT